MSIDYWAFILTGPSHSIAEKTELPEKQKSDDQGDGSGHDFFPLRKSNRLIIERPFYLPRRI
jgi:hypothetical protein